MTAKHIDMLRGEPGIHPDAQRWRAPAEPDFVFDDDNEYARERELLMEDLASDNDDFARSDEDGWYYSDEDSGMDAVPDSSDWED